MNFKKIDAPSIKELFLTQIEEMILPGELKPNDKLPPERELADTMGVSKTIVHEGIKELEALLEDVRISAWADYCEYTGRQNTYDMLTQTTKYIKAGNSEGAVRLFTEHIDRYKTHLLAQT